MFNRFKDKLSVKLANTLLDGYETEELEAGKRLVSVIAGIYILQRGIRTIKHKPFRAVEEITLGTILLYSAASGLNRKITKKPKEPSDMRKNQIQGNDPKNSVPAFV